MATPTGLRGFNHLIFRGDGGPVFVNHKTDAVPAAALDHRVAVNRSQLPPPQCANNRATGSPVVRSVLLLLSPTGSVERIIEDVEQAVVRLRDNFQTGAAR